MSPMPADRMRHWAGQLRPHAQRVLLETRQHPALRGSATGLAVGTVGAACRLPASHALALGSAAGIIHRHIAAAELRVARESRNARDAANLAAYTSLAGTPSFFGGYAIEPDFARLIVRDVEAGASTIVECGSGSSTLLIASLLRRRGDGIVYAFENDAAHARATQARLREADLAGWGHVIHAPLVEQDFGPVAVRWYDRDIIDSALGERAIDLLVVDGPHGDTVWARWPAVGVFGARLSPRAVVLLDDGRRRGERRTAARWAREHPEFELFWVDTTAGTWRLVRRFPVTVKSIQTRALHGLARRLNPQPPGHTMPVRR